MIRQTFTFVGGPRDGEVREVTRDSDGWPRVRLSLHDDTIAVYKFVLGNERFAFEVQPYDRYEYVKTVSGGQRDG